MSSPQSPMNAMISVDIVHRPDKISEAKSEDSGMQKAHGRVAPMFPGRAALYATYLESVVGIAA